MREEMRIESWTAQQSEAIAIAARNLDDHHSNLLAPARGCNAVSTRTIILEKSAEKWGDNCELRHSP